MTDWARSTIAKTRMWTSAVKAAEQQAEANFGTQGARPTATNLVAAGKLVWHARLSVVGTPAKSVGAARRAIR
jgi:hypothetical protein